MNGIEDGVMREVKRQINKLPDDDPMRLLLILNSANCNEIKKLKSNIVIKIGDFFEDIGRGAGIFVILLTYFLVVVVPNLLFRLIMMIVGIDITNFIK